MSFFYNEIKKADKPKAKKVVRRGDIPIASLQTLGCSVCPRDKDEGIQSPKMEPSGAKSPLVYLLGGSPSEEEDLDNNHWTDKAGEVIYSKFGSGYMKQNVRSNFITQCRGDQTVVEIECCRGRITSDIERTKPRVVVTVGDAPLFWATGVNSGALNHRGSFFVSKIGTHVCWVYCLMYPSFAFKKSHRKSEYEMALEHDVERLKEALETLPEPKVYDRDFDAGIEIIAGTEPGDMQRLEKALKRLTKKKKSSIDIEATGLRSMMVKDHFLVSCAVGTFDDVVAFSIDHPEGWGSEAQKVRVRSMLLDYLLESGRKCAHHLSMEMEWLSLYFGHQFLRLTEWDDTMALCHTLDERQGTKSLNHQVRMAFGFFLKSKSRIDVKRPKWWMQYPLVEILRYNGMDTKWTDKLRDHLAPKVAATKKLQFEYDRKVRLAPTLVKTELMGLEVDFVYAEEQSKRLEEDLSTLAAKIKRTPEVKEYQQLFGTFEPTRPEHVLELMKSICHRDEVRVEDKRSKTVRWTTDEEALNKIPRSEVPSAHLILEHRGLSKLKGTYVDPVVSRKIVCHDGRIRSKYGSMVAVTGRLNSEDPNIQNWPARKNKEIRAMITAARWRWLVACDYGQIEFRVVGMASGDENLVKACWTGYDVHAFWAQRIVDLYPSIKDYIVEEFEVDWDEKGLKTLRQEAKNGWVFPQLFGSSVNSCVEQLHIPSDVGEELAGEFWDEFRQVKKWQEKLLVSYEKNLYVETLGGRQRRGPMTKNEIINHPIQGTAFDIVAEGMNVCSEMADLMEDPELQPSLNVHDDLTFEMDDASLETKIPIIAAEMCRPRFEYINVPLIVEVKAGPNWFDLEELKVYKSNELFGTHNPYA